MEGIAFSVFAGVQPRAASHQALMHFFKTTIFQELYEGLCGLKFCLQDSSYKLQVPRDSSAQR